MQEGIHVYHDKHRSRPVNVHRRKQYNPYSWTWGLAGQHDSHPAGHTSRTGPSCQGLLPHDGSANLTSVRDGGPAKSSPKRSCPPYQGPSDCSGYLETRSSTYCPWPTLLSPRCRPHLTWPHVCSHNRTPQIPNLFQLNCISRPGPGGIEFMPRVLLAVVFLDKLPSGIVGHWFAHNVDRCERPLQVVLDQLSIPVMIGVLSFPLGLKISMAFPSRFMPSCVLNLPPQARTAPFFPVAFSLQRPVVARSMQALLPQHWVAQWRPHHSHQQNSHQSYWSAHPLPQI